MHTQVDNFDVPNIIFESELNVFEAIGIMFPSKLFYDLQT